MPEFEPTFKNQVNFSLLLADFIAYMYERERERERERDYS